jgi:hypothetical protein
LRVIDHRLDGGGVVTRLEHVKWHENSSRESSEMCRVTG